MSLLIRHGTGKQGMDIIVMCFSTSMLVHYILLSIIDNPGTTRKGRLQTNKILLFTFYTHIIKMFTTLYLGIKNHR